MNRVDGECTHPKQVRVTDCRDKDHALANIYTCGSQACIHEALHMVKDVTGKQGLLHPLPPV